MPNMLPNRGLRYLGHLPIILLRAREAVVRPIHPVQSSLTLWMTSRYQTRRTSQSPRAVRGETTPDLMIVDEDDGPLPERPKGMGKKEKSCPFTQEELDGYDDLVK